ncbi:MAG TPA: hypothetical protein VMS17_23420 [Gemmataceae bacterium]|nr:hypothetical protein [Gemmataceae bacterium]
MRTTAPLLLTAALLIPGAARAQPPQPLSQETPPTSQAAPPLHNWWEDPIHGYRPPPTLSPPREFIEEQAKRYAERQEESAKLLGYVGLACGVLLVLVIKALRGPGGGKDDAAR